MPHFLPTPRNESERVRLECLFHHMYEVSSSFASILSTLRTDTTPHRALAEFSLYKRILMAYKIHDDTHASTHSAVLCSSDFLTKLLWSTRALLMHKQIRQKFKSIHTKARASDNVFVLLCCLSCSISRFKMFQQSQSIRVGAGWVCERGLFSYSVST